MKFVIDSTLVTAVDGKGRDYIFVPADQLVELGLSHPDQNGLQCSNCDFRIPHARDCVRRCKKSAEQCLCDRFSRGDGKTGAWMLMARRQAYYRRYGEYLAHVVTISDIPVAKFPCQEKMTVEAALESLKKAMTDAGWVQYRLGWGRPDPGIPGVRVFSFLSAVEIQIDSNNKALPRKRHKPVGYIPSTETDDGQKQTRPGAG